MEITFKGKTVVITGGSSGIGKATAVLFANSGGRVFFTGLEDESEIDISNYHGRGDITPIYTKLDVRFEEDVRDFATFVDKEYGGCDVLINNAGILFLNILHETPTEQWKKILDVNLNGLYYTSKYFLPQMIRKGGGAVINMSSISGLGGDYQFSAYNASKGAISNLTRNMALDYARYNIRVNAVAPGSIKTPMYDSQTDGVGGADVQALGMAMVYPMGRNGMPEEVANAVLFLASDKASFISGINLVVDGGLTASTASQYDWETVRLVHSLQKEKQE